MLLAAEPGIGKRLPTETARAAHDEGGTVLFGACDEDVGLSYRPFVDALRHYGAHAPEAVAGLLAVASQESPLVLVLDDLHWAGAPELLLLKHLIRSAEPLRLLVIGTYRDTDLSRTHPLTAVLADLRKEVGVGGCRCTGSTTRRWRAWSRRGAP